VPVEAGAPAWRVAGGLVLSSTLHAALGVSVAAVIRSQTAAVAAVLVWILAVEGMLANVLHGAAVLRWLPASLGAAIVRSGAGRVPGWAAVAGLVLYVATLGAAGARFFVSRDVT
jgi:hypothetical protein